MSMSTKRVAALRCAADDAPANGAPGVRPSRLHAREVLRYDS